MTPMLVALILSGILFLIGGFYARRQLHNLRRLRRDVHIPSDEKYYLKRQVYRRFTSCGLLFVIGAMLSGSYLSGMEKRADELGERPAPHQENKTDPDGNIIPGAHPPEPAQHVLTPEEKNFLRMWSFYWIGVMSLLFVVILLAILDFWSTNRFARQQLKRIQGENRELLERDLALHRQQKINNRMRALGNYED